MEKNPGCVPILLIIYNRRDQTKRVLDRIRSAKPERLFIAADGPKTEKLDDKVLCEDARGVVEDVDWDCDVRRLYHQQNLGCKIAPSSAITWFFENNEEGIILEDDCLPNASFFRFCTELLEKFRDESRVGMISGNNFGFDLYDKSLSYSFSRHGLISGWATWKRCWEKFSIDLDFVDAANIDLIKSNISTNKDFIASWWEGVNEVLYENLDAWDYLWGVTRYANNYLTIRPSVNLVANIGFGPDATHSKSNPRAIYTTVGELEFPLVHPEIILPDRIADYMLERYIIQSRRGVGFISRAKIWLKKNMFR